MPTNSAAVQQTPIFNFDNIDPKSAEFKDFMVQLTQAVNNISLILNMKTSGYYDVNEFVSGNIYYPIPDPTGVAPLNWRPGIRKVIDVGTLAGGLPNAACIAVPHGITATSNFMFMIQYGVAYNPTSGVWLQFPYASSVSVASNIEMNVNATSINICTGIDYSGFTKVNVFLEYVTFN